MTPREKAEGNGLRSGPGTRLVSRTVAAIGRVRPWS